MNGRFRVARERMVDRIREKGLAGEAVLAAMAEIPRHVFVDSALAVKAYGEDALPIGMEQTLSHPEVVAYMTESLSISAGQRILEIGTGSGYQAALLHLLGVEVWTVERMGGLLEDARRRWRELGMDGAIRSRMSDGYEGWPEGAPFDRILVTASPRRTPAALLGQLAEGGLLLLPLDEGKGQCLVRCRREGRKAYREKLGACSFVPMLGRTVEV